MWGIGQLYANTFMPQFTSSTKSRPCHLEIYVSMKRMGIIVIDHCQKAGALLVHDVIAHRQILKLLSQRKQPATQCIASCPSNHDM